MRIFGVGTAGTPGAAESAHPQHPSAPIPVVGPGVGESLRVPLGETGLETFPLMLGAAEFGWNVDLETSHEILDRYAAALASHGDPYPGPRERAGSSGQSSSSSSSSA